MLALGCLLLYTLAALWPAAEEWSVDAGAAPTVHWLGGSFAPSAEVAMLLVVVVTGALGAWLTAVVPFADRAGNRTLAGTRLSTYLVHVTAGAALATLAYLVARGLLFTGTDVGGTLNASALAGLGGVVGLCADQAVGWLRARPSLTRRAVAGLAARKLEQLRRLRASRAGPPGPPGPT